MFPEHMDETAAVFILDDLQKLESPIERTSDHWVQGAVYSDLSKLESADNMTDII